jgi:hypothetical protein
VYGRVSYAGRQAGRKGKVLRQVGRQAGRARQEGWARE